MTSYSIEFVLLVNQWGFPYLLADARERFMVGTAVPEAAANHATAQLPATSGASSSAGPPQVADAARPAEADASCQQFLWPARTQIHHWRRQAPQRPLLQAIRQSR